MLEEQLKKINELSFQANKTKDEKEKEQLENDVKSIIFDLKKQEDMVKKIAKLEDTVIPNNIDYNDIKSL